jgi:hypothetical protein
MASSLSNFFKPYYRSIMFNKIAAVLSKMF